MTKMTAVNSSVVIASQAKQSRLNATINRDRRVAPSAPRDDKSKPEVDVEVLHKDLQNKRRLLNLLEEKGIAHKIDVKAIDKALADLYVIMEAKESATRPGGKT